MKKWSRTETGQLQTGAKALARFSNHPMVKPLSRFKGVAKLLSTYSSSYAEHVNPVTGRIHASFRIGGTVSGRFSCNTPNIQNPPRDKSFRALFCAPPEKTLLVADYSQIELRVAALISGDQIMLEAYEKGLDLHKKTAAEVSGTPFEEVTKEQRQAAKAINFGLLFGQGAKGLADYAQAKYGVEMTQREAEKARNAFFRTYKGFARWQKKTDRLSKLQQKAITPMGRVRDFRKSSKGYSYTEALNLPIQGGAAEVMLAALARLKENMKGIDFKLVNVIHDEMVIEVKADDIYLAEVGLEVSMIEGMRQIFPTPAPRIWWKSTWERTGRRRNRGGDIA